MYKICKRGESNGWAGIFISTVLHRMLKGEEYHSSDEVFPFVVAFIDWSTEYEKTAPMTIVHMWYNEKLADLKGDMRQIACV